MNQVIYKMLCGCKLRKHELATIQKAKNKAICCPVHEKFLKHRYRECVECGEIVFQFEPRARVSKRCEKCTHERDNKIARANSKAYHKKKQAAKGLLVEKYKKTLKGIEELEQMLKPKPKPEPKKKPEKKFLEPKRARTMAEARRKGIPHIEVKALFDLRKLISKLP